MYFITDIYEVSEWHIVRKNDFLPCSDIIWWSDIVESQELFEYCTTSLPHTNLIILFPWFIYVKKRWERNSFSIITVNTIQHSPYSFWKEVNITKTLKPSPESTPPAYLLHFAGNRVLLNFSSSTLLKEITRILTRKSIVRSVQRAINFKKMLYSLWIVVEWTPKL